MSMNDTAPETETANPKTAAPPQYTPGPFKETHTRTIEIQGPIKFTLTETTDSSHVPPIEAAAKPCGCGGHAAPSSSGITLAQLSALLPEIASAIADHIKVDAHE